MNPLAPVFAFVVLTAASLAADTESVRRVPPPGIEIPQADRDELTRRRR